MSPITQAKADPGRPRMIHKSFRVPADLYRLAKLAAKERGDSLSEVLRRALEQYVRDTRIG